MKDWGYTETYTYSLQSEELLRKFRLKTVDHLKLKNPLTAEWVYLRTSILPSLLEVLGKNTLREEVSLFELSKVYLPQQKGLPYEIQRLSLVSDSGFYEVKGIVEQLLSQMHIPYYFDPHEKITQLHPYQTAVIKSKKDGLILGIIGQVFSPITQSFSLKGPIIAADLNFDKLVFLAKKQSQYVPLPKYPPITEDLTFINQSGVLAQKIVDKILVTNKLLNQVNILGIFKNNISLRIDYQNPNRSLNDKEVAEIRKKIVANLEKLGLVLRGQLN